MGYEWVMECVWMCHVAYMKKRELHCSHVTHADESSYTCEWSISHIHVCTCMYVCMYVCMYACTYACTCVYMNVCMYVCMNTRVYIQICALKFTLQPAPPPDLLAHQGHRSHSTKTNIYSFITSTFTHLWQSCLIVVLPLWLSVSLPFHISISEIWIKQDLRK